MNAEYYEGLKGRFKFDEWRDRNTLNENLFIWRFFFRGDEFPNWQPHQIRELAPPPARQGMHTLQQSVAEAPRLVHSVWRPSSGNPNVAFSVDSYECASRAAAHELLVRFLGEFQSPLVARQTEPAIGDVAFVHPGNAIILFARANHVIVIRSIGATQVPVNELAGQLDHDLTEKPPAVLGRVEPMLRSLRPAKTSLKVGSQTRLEIEAAPAAGQPLMYKFFSPAGQVLAKEGQLVYAPAAPGEQDLDVYAVAPDRGVGNGKIHFKVE